MKIAIIGRTEILFETACLLHAAGHAIVCIITAKEASEYTRNAENFRQLAEQWGIPYACSSKIAEYRDLLAASGADIGISLNYSGIISRSVIELFPLGILNAHGGDLPRYRGNACQAWAIINGEERIGLCVHRMIADELDSGDIVAREYFEINLRTKVTEVYRWMGERIPMLFSQALARLTDDPSYVLESQSKDAHDALRCYPRRPEDGRIDWRKSNTEILRLINACNKPYAGAFCELEGKKVIIWVADVAPEECFLAVPGQIAKITTAHIDIATGSGMLRVTEAELDGKAMCFASVCRSIRQRFR